MSAEDAYEARLDENMEVNIDVDVPLDQINHVGNVEFAERNNPIPPPTPTPQAPRAAPPINNINNQNVQQNQFGTVRDRLFHAMLVRVALRYSARFKLNWRRFIEFLSLFGALLLLASLLFVHLNFSRSTTSCLKSIRPNWIKDGVVRVEVVKNLRMLEEQENYINWYITERSFSVCRFSPKDIFLLGPRVIPAEIRAMGLSGKTTPPRIPKKTIVPAAHHGLMSFFTRAPTELLNEKQATDENLDDDEGKLDNNGDPLETEANDAWRQHFQRKFEEDDNYEYMYRVEYALLYGVLRLPPSYREKHDIPTVWVRIDAESSCFGDALTRGMMRIFVGYEDAIVASLRATALNHSINGDSNSMGYLHDLQTHEHYHFVANMLGKTSYLTAAILMFIFTFAISMLLRFSHHQIFLFIIDLLHMFELQQPLYFPVAPIFTVILALVGMEAIMSEVFNDTTTAFYVILIVWVADQFDAICCHSPISKRYWLRFFYMYQFFFYAYQYRFGGQYGGLALWTSTAFILHSMIYFFHHYEMPLILYQDRVQQVLAELHAPANNMGTVEVQTITVAVRHPNVASPVPVVGNSRSENVPRVLDVRRNEDYVDVPASQTSHVQTRPQPLSPSSVFDARGPALLAQTPSDSDLTVPTPIEEPEPTNPEEIVARQVVSDAMDELFASGN